MLQITHSQMAKLDRLAWDVFVNEVAEHLQTYFPWCQSYWPQGNAHALAVFGCERARHYGFETERQITLFVNLMPVLGSRFDENPLLPWAAEKLADPMIREPVHRIDQLSDLAMRHLRRTNGRNGKQAYAGLKAVHGVLLSQVAPPDAPGALMYTFPERAAASPATHQVLRQAVERAHAFGLKDEMGAYICAALTLFFGPSFYTDPQLPAINALLYDARRTPDQKSEGLRTLVLEMITALAEYSTVEGA